jgi:hypothetical protein
MYEMIWAVSRFSHNRESSESQHGDFGLDALDAWKKKDCLRDYVVEKGGDPLC